MFLSALVAIPLPPFYALHSTLHTLTVFLLRFWTPDF